MSKVLITGSTGYVGRYLVNLYKELGFEVETMAREKATFCQDIRDEFTLPSNKYKQVIHCAGKAHVYPKTEEEKKSFFDINQKGFENLLGSLKNCKVDQLILLSTAAVYGETGIDHIENDINPITPYGKSKVLAEKFGEAWSKKNNVPFLILRLPLIIGPKAPGNLQKMITGLKSGKYLSINNGTARRSMVLLKDIGILMSSMNNASGVYNLTDDQNPSFKEIELAICKKLGLRKPINLGIRTAKFLGKIGDRLRVFPVNTGTINKMTTDFTLSCEKAKKELLWEPTSVVENIDI